MTENVPGPRVVVGVDGSPPSKLALQWAEFLATTMQASIEAVSAWHIPAALIPAAGLPDVDLQSVTAQTLHDTVVGALGDTPAVPVHELVGHGDAAQVLLQASKDAQMLVVGSRGHGGFTGLLLGSVSAACTQHAQCPVLVVHGDTPPPNHPS
jgi:nucleotide-binding universal stress UspA family protein